MKIPILAALVVLLMGAHPLYAQSNSAVEATSSSDLESALPLEATTTDMLTTEVLPVLREKQPGDNEFLEGNVIAASTKGIRNWSAQEKQEFLTKVKTFGQVQSGEDLENFAYGIFLKDERITEVQYSYKEMMIEYKGKAKLFGFIPFDYTHTVTIATESPASNRVKVHFPWYGFLLKSGIDPEFIKTAIAVDLSGDIGSSDIGKRTSAYASALETIAKVLKKRHDIAANIIAQ